VPSAFTTSHLITWLDVASGFTLNLLSFSSYCDDAATCVDYDVLADPVMPSSWMWARFSDDRNQVNVGFREPPDFLLGAIGALFGPVLAA
jgi:hypothetical protein